MNAIRLPAELEYLQLDEAAQLIANALVPDTDGKSNIRYEDTKIQALEELTQAANDGVLKIRHPLTLGLVTPVKPPEDRIDALFHVPKIQPYQCVVLVPDFALYVAERGLSVIVEAPEQSAPAQSTATPAEAPPNRRQNEYKMLCDAHFGVIRFATMVKDGRYSEDDIRRAILSRRVKPLYHVDESQTKFMRWTEDGSTTEDPIVFNDSDDPYDFFNGYVYLEINRALGLLDCDFHRFTKTIDVDAGLCPLPQYSLVEHLTMEDVIRHGGLTKADAELLEQPLPRIDTNPKASSPTPVVQAKEPKEQRQDRRLQACIDAGLPMDTKTASLRLPDGVGLVADRENVSRQAFSTDVKAALKRQKSARREGGAVHRA